MRNFTKTTANLKTVTGKFHHTNIGKLDTEELYIGDKNVLDLIQEENVEMKDFINRIPVGDNEYYMIYDDAGQPVYTNLPEKRYNDFFRYTPIIFIPDWAKKYVTVGHSMFARCPQLKIVKRNDIDFSSLTRVQDVFRWCDSLESLDCDMSTITYAGNIVSHCSNLKTININLDSLDNGYYAFEYNTKLESFTSSFPALTTQTGMFSYCESLPAFNIDMPLLTNGQYMFRYCYKLASFSCNLSSLTNGTYMFFNCTSLRDFTSNIENLTNGNNMFAACSSLNNFTSKLTSLTNGSSMFYGCKLNKASVMNIINSIKNDNTLASGSGGINIGIDASLKTDTELLEFLGLTNGVNTSIKVKNPKGISWTIYIVWN